MPDVFDASKKKTSKTPSKKAAGPRDFVKKNLPPVEAVDYYSEVMRREKPSHNPFDAYAPKPLMIDAFDSQLDGEQILLLLRKHPITQIGKILIILFLLIAPFFISVSSIFPSLPAPYTTATTLLWYLLASGYTIESFFTWFYHINVITNERVIDIDFLSLIYKNISAAKLDKIEDITAISGGVLESIFDYGSVRVQTAAEVTEFVFEKVPHPNKVAQFLNEMLVEEEQEKMEGRVK